MFMNVDVENHWRLYGIKIPSTCILRGRNKFCTPRGERTTVGSNAPEAFLVLEVFQIGTGAHGTPPNLPLKHAAYFENK